MTPTNTVYKCVSCQSLITLENPVPEYALCPLCEDGLLIPYVQSPDELEINLFKDEAPMQRKFKTALAAILSIFNIMLSECAYCDKIKGIKKGGKGITSGICKKCLVIELAKLEREKNELESPS